MATIKEPSALASRAAGTTRRSFAISGEPRGRQRWFVEGLRAELLGAGYEALPEPGPDTDLVLHCVDPATARPYRRKAAATFVVAIAELATEPDDLLRAGYPLLVRALANLCVLVVDGPDGPGARFVTLEQGTYGVGPGVEEDKLFRRSFERVEPLASSRLVIANEFVPDLPEELWDGDVSTQQIRRAGERLATLDLLPTPFPMDDYLSERDQRHVKLLFGIGGLSYGNVSARRIADDGIRTNEFWMSASGVDKSALTRVGEHILLVREHDPERGAMVLSVPPDLTPRRVSVDAIEHWMIYREHPDVGAILHVHGWIDGIESTDVNYPCGTIELAQAVAELVRRSPDPSRAVVGQRNHGMTITGHDLDEIFERVGDRIVDRVPME